MYKGIRGYWNMSDCQNAYNVIFYLKPLDSLTLEYINLRVKDK